MPRKKGDKRYVSGVLQMRWTDKYIKIPFKDRGNGFDGCDCWGLLRLILREELGVEISDHSDVKAGDLLAKVRKITKGSVEDSEWQKIKPGQETTFDCVLMKGHVRCDGAIRSVPVHIGCVTLPGKLIHIEKERDVTVVNYRSHPLVKNRVLGFYRCLI